MYIKDTDDTKTKVMKSTILLFNKYGPMVPMSQISDMAGVAAGTPFKHFKTKEELLKATYHYARLSVRNVELEDPLSQATTEDSIKAIVRGVIRWAALYPQEHEYVQKYEDAVCYDYFSERFASLYTGIVEELGIWERIREDVRQDIPKEIINRMISVHCSVFIRYMSHHHMQLGAPETEALLEASVDSVWSSLKRM